MNRRVPGGPGTPNPSKTQKKNPSQATAARASGPGRPAEGSPGRRHPWTNAGFDSLHRHTDAFKLGLLRIVLSGRFEVV